MYIPDCFHLYCSHFNIDEYPDSMEELYKPNWAIIKKKVKKNKEILQEGLWIVKSRGEGWLQLNYARMCVSKSEVHGSFLGLKWVKWFHSKWM